MRAFRLHAWKHDPVLDVVEPPSPRPGEVLIRIGGAGACHSDLHLMREFDETMMPWTLPFTLGHENAGWVRELGAGVTGLEVGQPVAVYGPWGCGTCHSCVQGAENYCVGQPSGAPVGGLGRDGGMADLMLVPHARHVVPLGDSLDPIFAAPLTDAGLTPYHAIRATEHLLAPGTTAVVIGIGGLGHLGVQILRATTDVRVVAVDTRTDALQLAKDCGADELVNADENAAATIKELSDGVGATAVFDMVGADATLRLAAQSVRVNGWIGIVGLGGGSLPVSVLGLPFGVVVRPTYWGTRPELAEVLALAERGDLSARITTFHLSRAAEAYDALRAGLTLGRAVVVPDDPYMLPD